MMFDNLVLKSGSILPLKKKKKNDINKTCSLGLIVSS